MNTPANTSEPADAGERERAAGTFNRNLVVTAGAGTGKTTLLVDRLVQLLLRNPEPLKITEIVALTFTNKAANEMKLRLRERLQSYLAVTLDREAANDSEKKTYREVESLIDRFQLSKHDLDERVHEALRNIERSSIGTIHSFAATLLRLYPMEAGIDPQFEEDDGKQFERIFDQQWDLWLDQELALTGKHSDDWRKILRKLGLDQVKALAGSLCSESVDLQRGQHNALENGVLELLQPWFQDLESTAAALMEVHTEDRQNEKLVRAALSVIREFRRCGAIADNDLGGNRSLLSEKSINRDIQGWPANDLVAAARLVRVARGLVRIDSELTEVLWGLLVPFAETFREFFVREGFVSFDGLLIRARNLIRDRRHVREELKRQFRAILIDEFQDTDPIQYEIILYLAEEANHSARDWRNVKLTRGKIFVVGDPKQSIYAFRRADIEAYLEVVERVIKAQDGMECRLTTNFRSHVAILDVVNGVFKSLMQPRDGVQPDYIAINPAPQRIPIGGKVVKPLLLPEVLPQVTVRKIVCDKEMSAEKARRIEGESLARWLKDEIFGRVEILNSSGELVRTQPKDIAILFRKLTDIHDYLEPFRRNSIRYVVEGERHFYAAKEIIDAVNLFQAIANPYDRLALVGVLRSPLGGLTDQTIYELHRRHLLDYREAKRLKDSALPRTVAELYQKLAKLHEETPKLPVGAAVSCIFASLPLKPLAACTFHGEQAVANLEKLCQQAELLGREGLTTLKEAMHQLRRRVLDIKEEGESVLAEENLDAVRIMSIHKAKGLEFPIVILAGCQAGTEAQHAIPAAALFDWSTGLTGLRVGRTWDLAGLYITEKTRLRAEEEQKRVLYVAMTRAREHLVISCAPTGRRSNGSFLAMLDETFQNRIAIATESKTLTGDGSGEVALRLVPQTLAAPGRPKHKRQKVAENQNWQAYVDTWTRRRHAYESIIKKPVFVTPTLLKQQEEEITEAAGRALGRPSSRTPAMLVGELAHRFLESWDFIESGDDCADRLETLLDQWLPVEFRAQRAAVHADLTGIFRVFFRSKIYAELSRAKILGREVPLLMPWDGQIMEGVIDLIYEQNGLLYLADYKTDTISTEERTTGAARYHRQAEVYSRALRESLQRDVAAFNVIFLRLGEAIRVPLERAEETPLPVQLRLL
ncbi:MAG TPA: UvrD-helicase domain-containing protein [Candidatus Binatia bacterium]